MSQPHATTSCPSICDLPTHLVHPIFASAAAPLTTCKASAAIASDASLTAQWLLAQNQQPLQRAAAGQLWDVCELLLGIHNYRPGLQELELSLLKFAAAGRETLVHTLLQQSASQYPEAHRTMTFNALGHAVSNHHLPLTTALVSYPCMDATRLSWAANDAAAAGSVEEVHVLLTSRPDITTPDMWGEAMYRAAGRGHTQTMQHLLQHGASLGHDTQEWLWQALMRACLHNRVDSAAWLLAQSIPDEEVGAVLVCTGTDESVAVINLFLTQQPGCMSTHGARAVYTALSCTQLEAARVLLELAAPEDVALSWPAFTRGSEQTRFQALNSQMTKYAPEHLAPVLEAAIQHGHSQVARMLRFCGATCSLDDAPELQQAEAAPAGGLHPIN
jgi:hypothetical protein